MPVHDLLVRQAATASRRAPDDAAQRGLLRQAEAQVVKLQAALLAAEGAVPDSEAAKTILCSFAPVWAELAPQERQKLLRSLVDHVDIDGHAGKVVVTFASDGIAAMARAGATV